MLNSCTFIGRLVKDPEIRNLNNGDMLANISIAVNKTWKDKSGNKQESTEFINCSMFGPFASVIQKYYKKGLLVLVEGEFTTRSWEDESGQKKYASGIKMKSSKILQSLNSENLDQGNQQQQPQQNHPMPDDDLPF